MRPSVRLGAALVALAFCAACRDRSPLQRVDSAPLVAPAVIDFGLISLHGQARRSVDLENAGRAPLRVHGVDVTVDGIPQSSQGAPLPFLAVPNEQVPLTLTNGQRTRIQLSLMPRTAGPVHGYMDVHNDSSEAPDLKVELRAEVVDAQAQIGPEQLDFGAIEIGTSVTQTLTIKNPFPLPVTVTPTPTGPDAAVFRAQPITIPPQVTLPLPVTFSPTREGKVTAQLSVTRCEGCDATVVTLYGEGLESAMVVDPNPLVFGSVPVDATAKVDCRLINVSSVPLELKGVALEPGTDEGYHEELPVPDFILPPGAWLATTVRFTPTHLGQATGNLLVSSSSRRHPVLQVPLIGRGGGAEIAIAPDQIDLGTVPVGALVTTKVHVRNAGNTEPLTLSAVMLAGSPQFTLGAASMPLQLAPGNSADFVITYEPSAAGDATATLTIDSSDGSTPHVQLPIHATARLAQPCTFQLLPQQIDFGNVAPGSGAVLGLRFTNQGTDQCAVKNVHVAQDAQGAFFMPGGALAGLILDPGDSFQAQVAFKPNQAGEVHGMVSMSVSDPANPTVGLPLRGISEPTCLAAAPGFIDFGALRRDCSHTDRRTHLINACNQPITVGPISVGSGTTNEFTLVSPPPTPMTLQPGGGFNLELAYAGLQLGQNFAPLFIGESDVTDGPFLIPLLGEGLPDGQSVDHFVQADGRKADVLFVVDNSNSMAEEQPRLQAAIPAFVQAAQAKGMDLHVAVTTTGIDAVATPGCGGGANGGEAGRLFPVDGSMPRIVDLSQPNPAQEISNDMSVGLCHHLEQGLEATRRALSSPLVDHADDPRTPAPNDGNLGFLRDDAQLSVVVVSDEDDHSGDDAADYANFLRTVKGLAQPQRVGFYGIVPLSSCSTASGASAPRYQAVAQATGGATWDVCGSDYGPALAQIADRSFGRQSRFPLTRAADPSSVQVLIDGQPASPGSWSFDSSVNAVVFGTAPAAGAKIDVHYKQLCP